MKNLLCVTILLVLSAQSQASWFEDIYSFFSADEKKTENTTTKEVETLTDSNSEPSGSTTELVKTGLALLPMLMQTLGITESQAGGGLGALLTTAQSLMKTDQFSSLASAIPNASSLMESVPALSSSSSSNNDLVGSALSLAGENSGTLKAGADLVSQFSSLDLEAGMIGKFTNVTSQYLSKSNKTEEADLLTSAISGLF